MVRKVVAILLLLALPSLPAFAGEPGGPRAVQGSVRFSSRDHDVWRDYWHEESKKGRCAPGLARKGGGCVRLDPATKRYTIGRPLPPGVVMRDVPDILLPKLTPCPAGFRYGMVDGDLVQLALDTHLVVDAIQGWTN